MLLRLFLSICSYEAGPYTLARQVNEGWTLTSSVKCLLCPTSTGFPPIVGVPDISHGIRSTVTLRGIGRVIGLENRQAMRRQSGFLRSDTAAIDLAHGLTFDDCILTKSRLATSRVLRSSMNSKSPLSLKGADVSCFPQSMSTFLTSFPKSSSSRCFCCAIEGRERRGRRIC